MPPTTCFIEWSDSLSMGHPGIDAEHRHFIALVNQLNLAILDRKEKSEIEHIMHAIEEDARSHFDHEDRLLAACGFPLALEHAQIHRQLITNLQQAMETLHRAEFEREWLTLGLDIKSLLLSHLLSVDRQYIDYLAAPDDTPPIHPHGRTASISAR